MQRDLRLKIRSQKGSEENLMIYKGKGVKEKGQLKSSTQKYELLYLFKSLIFMKRFNVILIEYSHINILYYILYALHIF